jgi:putative DNA primase/helicase
MIDGATTQTPRTRPIPVERKRPTESEKTKLVEAAHARPGEGPDLGELLSEVVGPPIRRLTELGNAEFLVDRYGDVIRYSHPTKTWYVWDGTRWTEDRAAMVAEFAQDTTRAMLADSAYRGLTREDRERAAKWALQSESAQRIRAMLELARSIPGVPVMPEDFDRDPWLLNCPNGTVDLRDGRLRPHSRDDLITTLCPTAFDPTARAPRWDRFLTEITGGDDDLAGYLLRLMGYCITGIIREQVFPILWGNGANGKSVFLDTIKAVVGPDYATEAAPDLLVVSKTKQHPTELADLRGRRLVVASETAEGAEMRVQLVKRLSGDDRIKARLCFGNFFEFQRTHKTVLVTNYPPEIREDTEAIWRRVRMFPFAVTIPPEKRDSRLLETLRTEAPGILASLVRGCLDWQRVGLGSASAVTSATTAYRSKSDLVLAFIESECERDPSAWTSFADLLAAFKAWSPRTTTETAVAIGLAKHFERSKSGGLRGYQGVRLRAEKPREEERCPI